MSLLGGVGEQLNFLIDLNADGAIREAKRFGDTVEKETKKADDGLSKFSAGAAKFGIGAVAFGGAVLGGLSKAVDAYADAEKQHLKLTTAVGNSDTVFSDQGKAVADAAQALQGYTAVEGDAAEAGAAMLVQFGLTEDQIISLLPLVGDLSRRFGVDMETAAKAVGKAASGEGALGLKKMGIVLDETSYSADAFGTTMSGLNDTVGGFARGEAETAAGKIEMLKNNLGDIVEGVGAGAADVLGKVVGPIADIAAQGGAAGDVLAKIGSAGAVLGAGSVLIGGLSLAASSVAKLKANLTDAEGGLTRLGTAAKAAGIVAGAVAMTQLAGALNDATKDAVRFDTALKNLASAKGIEDKAQALFDAAEGTEGWLELISHATQQTFEIDLGGKAQEIGSIMAAIDQAPEAAQKLEFVNTALAAMADQDLDPAGEEFRNWLLDQKDALDKNAEATTKKEKADKSATIAAEDAAEAAQEWTDALAKGGDAATLYALSADAAAAGAKGFADEAERLDSDEWITSSIGLGNAFQAVGQSVKDLPKQFNENAAALGLYTDEQEAALGAVVGWGDAAKAQIGVLLEAGAGTEEVRRKTTLYRDSLTQVMTQAGFTQEQIEEYQRIMGLTDPQVETEIKLAGDTEARFKLQFMQGQLDKLDEGAQSEILALIHEGEYAAAERRLTELSRERTAKVNISMQASSDRLTAQAEAALGQDLNGNGVVGRAVVPGVNGTAAAVPVMGSVGPQITINLPAGNTSAGTLASIRRYQRLGGDMGGLLDTAVAVR